ncbi:hypothetical protein AMTR_s00165p00026750 [Amborella trichopoda]|uniref:UDP-glycosyltransferases domain-containing protein n=1 Tax=Amborella trichopoda TaxID=13333 RepID=W1PW70_AMBTC|nr:hypothetical protein AMTR_s00165p00026750 [Amborella trichopoda]
MEEKRVAGLHGYKKHLLLFPLPAQGHINPMVQLANILHNRGFYISIVQTDFRAAHLKPRPGFAIENICLGLSHQEILVMDIMEVIFKLNEKCNLPFRALIKDLQSREGSFPISCLITDALLYLTQDAAEELGIMRMALRTSSPTSQLVYESFPVLIEKGYLGDGAQFSDEEPLSDLSPLRQNLQCLCYNIQLLRSSRTPHSPKTSTAIFRQSLHHWSPGLTNSCEPLARRLQLHLLARYKNLWVGNIHSFGSAATIDSKQLIEIAWGLANSGCPFLWVVRPGLVSGVDEAELPSGFMDQVGSRGLVVRWAPQKEVLAHRAVGAFWTHCGWNSTLESV